MKDTVLRAAGGGLAGAAALALVLVLSPWRPDGLLVAAIVTLIGLPYTTSFGVKLAVKGTASDDDVALMGKVAGFGAPVMLVLLLFTILAVAGDGSPALQQLIGVLLAGCFSAALAARFTSSLARLAPEGDTSHQR